MSEEHKSGTWRELLDKTLDLGLGAVLLTKETAKKLVDDLVKRGELSKEEGHKFITQMLEKGQVQKEKMEELINNTLQRLLNKTDLARQSTVQELEQRIIALEEEIKRGRGSAP